MWMDDLGLDQEAREQIARVESMLLGEFEQIERDNKLREEGRLEGLEEEYNRLSRLYLSLIQEGKMEDLKRALQDNDFCDQLLQIQPVTADNK